MAMKYITYAAIPLMAASLSTQAATVDQLSKQVQKLNQRIAAADQRLRINGFASFGLAVSNEEMAYNGVNDEVSFSKFSKAGVQMTFNLDSQNSVVTQLVSRGENGWATEAEWAYFKHEFGGGLSGKIGRIRLPAYQLSEFLDVGYATPYATTPAETYDSLKPFANMDGFDLSYSMDIGDYTAMYQFVYGKAQDDEFELKDLLAVNAVLQADTWNARLGYGQAALSFVSQTFIDAVSSLYGGEIEDVDADFKSIGFTYDPGELYFTMEATQLGIDGPAVDAESAYATVGYRMGQWMPTLTYATTESTDDSERTLEAAAANTPYGSLAALNALVGASDATAIATLTALTSGTAGFQAASDRSTTRIGLGARYDMSAGTALKIQYDIVEVDDASGLFDDTAWATNAATSQPNPDGTNILTISIDTVF